MRFLSCEKIQRKSLDNKSIYAKMISITQCCVFALKDVYERLFYLRASRGYVVIDFRE